MKTNLSLSPSQSTSSLKDGQNPPRKSSLSPQLMAHCREMRKNATDAENLLWLLLRNRQLLGYKFRRQCPVNNYIVDFYCYEVQLGIELDGGGHTEDLQATHDQVRTQTLEAQGIKIIRFWNDEVLKNTQTVLEEIAFALDSLAKGKP